VSQLIDEQLLRRFDVPGPRYTSYPTADRFVEAFGSDDYIQALEQRRAGSMALPLSLYIHIPFCESLCYYCACNKVITRHHSKSAEYLRYLSRELELQVEHFGRGHQVSQMHLGGGSPTFLSDSELTDLLDMVKRHFTLVAGGEFSIEVDPRTVSPDRLRPCIGSASTVSASVCRTSTRRCRRRCTGSSRPSRCSRWSRPRARSASSRSTST
jgi:oxygen-independent coproporphyrinogen-3 oxidase